MAHFELMTARIAAFQKNTMPFGPEYRLTQIHRIGFTFNNLYLRSD